MTNQSPDPTAIQEVEPNLPADDSADPPPMDGAQGSGRVPDNTPAPVPSKAPPPAPTPKAGPPQSTTYDGVTYPKSHW